MDLGREEQEAFEKLKEWLCRDDTCILVDYDPSLKLGSSCDTSEVGICAVFFTTFRQQ